MTSFKQFYPYRDIPVLFNFGTGYIVYRIPVRKHGNRIPDNNYTKAQVKRGGELQKLSSNEDES